MPKRVTFAREFFSLVDVAAYHQDTEASLRLFFTSAHPQFAGRFFGYSFSQVEGELAERLNETDLRSALALLSRLEAAFRIDYLQRCQKRRRDPLSRAFRELSQSRGARARLEDEIFEIWQTIHPPTKQLITDLRGAFKFRHWLAHGRYWEPKFGREYDYQGIYALADTVLQRFPLLGP